MILAGSAVEFPTMMNLGDFNLPFLGMESEVAQVFLEKMDLTFTC